MSRGGYLVSVIVLGVLVPVLAVVSFMQLNAANQTRAALSSAQATLEASRSELQAVSGTLDTTRSSLKTVEQELSQSKTEIAAVQARLSQTRSELQATQAEVARTKAELATTGESLAQAKASYETAQKTLATTADKVKTTQDSLDNLQTNYDRLTDGYGYILKDPTYKMVKDFITADKTDQNKYHIDSYNCQDFSSDVIKNAARQKLRVGYVAITYPGTSGHAVVAFNTTDKGVIYFEPQTDEEVLLQVGKRFYQSIMPKPGYIYETPDYNDTVMKVTVIW